MDVPSEFARIVACERCTSDGTSRKLLRDGLENIPQPGFIGANFYRHRVALAGQNPGLCTARFAQRDSSYTAALRTLRDCPTEANMRALNQILLNFIPDWPVHGSYFPLAECGLALDEIAYFNVVRCRTIGNSSPASQVTKNCLEHFDHWLETLAPRVLVFIGKWAYDRAGHLAAARGIPAAFMNRERSLCARDRAENRSVVIEVVRTATSA